MPENPVLAYRGPDSRAIPITATLFDGSTVSVRGTVGAGSATPGDVTAAWSGSGPQAHISYSGDPKKIEFLEYSDPVDGRPTMRRVTFAERIASAHGWNTCRCVMQTEPEMSGLLHVDFDPADFGDDFG